MKALLALFVKWPKLMQAAILQLCDRLIALDAEDSFLSNMFSLLDRFYQQVMQPNHITSKSTLEINSFRRSDLAKVCAASFTAKVPGLCPHTVNNYCT